MKVLLEMMPFESYCFWLKNGTPVFWKFSFSRKSVSKLNYWKRFHWLPHKKHADLANGGLFWKSPVPFYRITHALSVGIKMKTLKKAFSNVKTKTNLNFAVKLAESSNHSFLLSIWWIIFLKHLYSLIRAMECKELNSCVNIWKRSEAAKKPFLYWEWNVLNYWIFPTSIVTNINGKFLRVQNLGQNIVGKFTKVMIIDFSMAYFTADFSQLPILAQLPKFGFLVVGWVLAVNFRHFRNFKF